MLNVVVMIGRLATDPELRYTQAGDPVGNFRLAVERPFTNRSGERDVDFVDIVVWRKLAETCSQYLGKGRLVAVNGRLQIRSYEDREGNRRRAAEVVANDVRFLDWPDDGGGRGPKGNKGGAAQGRPSRGSGGDAQGPGAQAGQDEDVADLDDFTDDLDITDDDIPF